ncbi:MAG TPA: GvpL/GvpF family gas vesicle protein [Gemmatimonadaceae bacterium]
MSAQRLYAIAALEHGDAGPLVPNTDLFVYKELGAVVSEAPWQRPAGDARDVDAYRAVIEAAFARRTILPAPVGTTFRSEEGLRKWMELHYVSLADGLGFVEGRAMARVRVVAAPSPDGGASGGMRAAELFREMRRHAVAAIPHPRPEGAADVLMSSFLVERERWAAFEGAVAQLGRQAPGLDVRLSGPWPPYDFVRLQFGG